VPLTETLAPTTWPFCSRTADWTYGLSLKTTILDKATPSSVQHSEAYFSSGRPNHRTENIRPPIAHSHRWRSGVESRGNTRQSLALEKIPVSHQVERVWPRTQFLGVCLQSLCTRTDSRVLLQTPRGSETHLICRVRQYLSSRVHCSET